jgi:hypothetical protein
LPGGLPDGHLSNCFGDYIGGWFGGFLGRYMTSMAVANVVVGMEFF